MSNWISLPIKFFQDWRVEFASLTSWIIHKVNGDLEIPLIASKALSIGLLVRALLILFATSIISLSLSSFDPNIFRFSSDFRSCFSVLHRVLLLLEVFELDWAEFFGNPVSSLLILCFYPFLVFLPFSATISSLHVTFILSFLLVFSFSMSFYFSKFEAFIQTFSSFLP